MSHEASIDCTCFLPVKIGVKMLPNLSFWKYFFFLGKGPPLHHTLPPRRTAHRPLLTEILYDTVNNTVTLKFGLWPLSPYPANYVHG